MRENMTIPRKWLPPKYAKEYLGCAESTLAKDRLTGLLGIPFARFGRHIRYSVEDLDAWLESTKQRGNTSAKG